ncbi:hypothetical protein NQ317_019706 [Molorchus minor]|uniref:Uncharacterized protein n=1 Tax=Molorchus minor TaxID=1323400 RepID=A0ABQ9JP40_9CUCU|nr:hypothetical protein NQ317_019706 [Molorchus minor]
MRNLKPEERLWKKKPRYAFIKGRGLKRLTDWSEKFTFYCHRSGDYNPMPRRFFFERVYFYRFLLQKSRFRYSNQRKKEKIKGFEVILEDTIIFPEGGGQWNFSNSNLQGQKFKFELWKIRIIEIYVVFKT